jgi:23S rRNA (guanine2445-N2)-methyltransferase
VQSFYATASAGTEDLLAAELQAIGAQDVRPGRGGVRFAGDASTALRACLWLRTAMRVLWPLRSFPAADADQLYGGVRAIDWREHLDAAHTFAVDAAGATSALRHTHFTALRVKDAIVDSLRDATGARPTVDPRDPDLRVVAHLSRGRCEVSLDVSGEPLFKRGYRVEPTRASPKETLAAAVILAAGYQGREPLVDPMCGSGTLAIEAALIAQNRAPGLGRPFGIERWKLFDGALGRELRSLRDEARASVRRGAPEIFASDRDPDATRAAAANVRRAGLAVRVATGDARELAPLSPPGWVVANPPYGERLEGGGRKTLKTFIWQLGRAWRELHGHRIAVLAGNPEFESAFGMRPVARRTLYNGPIECVLLRYDVP